MLRSWLRCHLLYGAESLLIPIFSTALAKVYLVGGTTSSRIALKEEQICSIEACIDMNHLSADLPSPTRLCAIAV